MPALLILAVTFLLMWVLFILPQQRRVKAHQAVLTRLQAGDEVMTTSGLYGTITELDDEVVSLEVAPKTVVRLARGAVARRLVEDVPAADTDTAADPATPSLTPGTRPAGTAADRAVPPSAPSET